MFRKLLSSNQQSRSMRFLIIKEHHLCRTYCAFPCQLSNHSLVSITLSILLFIYPFGLYHVNFLPTIGMSSISISSIKRFNFLLSPINHFHFSPYLIFETVSLCNYSPPQGTILCCDYYFLVPLIHSITFFSLDSHMGNNENVHPILLQHPFYPGKQLP